MRNLIPALFFMLFISISCSEDAPCPKQNLENSTLTNQDEFTIIETIINTQYKESEFIHISQGPLLNGAQKFLLLNLSKSVITFDSLAVEQYKSVNDSSFVWGDQISSSFEMINHNEILCHFEPGNGGWNSYFDKYEDSEGVLSLARPYINETGEAFLEFEFNCGYLCGYGYIAILKKEGQFWVLREVINTWIS